MSAINVNLRPCSHNCRSFMASGHALHCSGTPALIPCRLPPSFTCTVALGECTGSECYSPIADFSRLDHGPNCPARPVRVSCSISGKTWEDSEVADDDHDGRPDIRRALTARWALVKALVTGRGWAQVQTGAFDVRWRPLFAQRDAVYAALADMARAEELALQAQQRFYEACPIVLPTTRRAERPSVERLAAYVDHLVEQVGGLL